MSINIRVNTCRECNFFIGRDIYDFLEEKKMTVGVCGIDKFSDRTGLVLKRQGACSFSISREAVRLAYATGNEAMLRLVEPEVLIVS